MAGGIADVHMEYFAPCPNPGTKILLILVVEKSYLAILIVVKFSLIVVGWHNKSIKLWFPFVKDMGNKV